MKITPIYGNGALAVPKADVRKLVSCPPEYAKALLLMCTDLSDDICVRAGMSREDIAAAERYWRDLGVIGYDGDGSETEPAAEVSADGDAAEKRAEILADTDEKTDHAQTKSPAAQTVPSYTGSELEKIMNARAGLSDLVRTAQNILGKVFTPSEAAVIVMMRDHLELDEEYIILFLEYCRAIDKVSLRYIEKTVLSLFDSGVDNVPALTEYISRTKRAKGMEALLRGLYGMGARALTKKEKEILAFWAEKNVPQEFVERSYEMMIPRTQKPSISYQNAIISRWIQCGYTTIEQIDAEANGNGGNAAGVQSSYDTDEFFALALERGKQQSNK